MKKLWLAGCALATLAAPMAQANDLYFQMNPNLAGSNEQRQAFIFGAANATGMVTGGSGFSQAFNLGASGFAVVDVPLADQLSSGVVQNLGFKISSSSNLSAYFLNRRQSTTDMAYIIDGSKLGTSYIVAGYQNILPDQMSVQATVDNTIVTFSPKGAASFNVTLNAGQTYMHTANSNLTGSRITSTAPVSVFSGNQCANVPTGSFACDHQVEQMAPISSLSNSYVLSQTSRTGPLGNIFRAVATEDGTTVSVNGVVVANLNAGDYYEGRVSGGIKVDGNKKLLVTQYLTGQSEGGGNTDPAMTLIPGSDQWLKSYVFATPSGASNFPTDFINLIVPTVDIGSLMVDGAAVNPASFSAIAGTAFSFANIDVSSTSGPFAITAANPFQLLLSGHDNFDSYFTYGGAAFSPGASPPPPPPPPPMGGIPEPATWAMMIIGFGAIGSAMRRRRVSAKVSYN